MIRLNRLARQLREIALKASQGGANPPVTVGDLAVIETVSRNPDSTISEISKGTGLAQSWVSKIVRELSEQGVFQHSKDPSDRRQTRVRVAPAIRRTFADYGSRPIDDAVASAAPHLDAAGIQKVMELLTELAGFLVDNPDTAPGRDVEPQTKDKLEPQPPSHLTD